VGGIIVQILFGDRILKGAVICWHVFKCTAEEECGVRWSKTVLMLVQ
jgi:hypothetical protein